MIKKIDGELTLIELFELVKDDESFDKEHCWRFNQNCWRFNQNRLNQLLSSHYILNPNLNSIKDIYGSLN